MELSGDGVTLRADLPVVEVSGESMSARALEDAYWRIDRLVRLQTTAAAEAVWSQRVRLGFRLAALDQLPRSMRFGLHAHPAFSAHRLAAAGRPVRELALLRWCVHEALASAAPVGDVDAEAVRRLEAMRRDLD